MKLIHKYTHPTTHRLIVHVVFVHQRSRLRFCYNRLAVNSSWQRCDTACSV